MKKKIIPTLILGSILVLGCKNDDNVVDQKRLPKSITGVDTNISFQYNGGNQLVKVSDKTSNAEYSETLFTYNVDGKLSKFVNASYYNGNVSTETYVVNYLDNNLLRVEDEDNEYVLIKLNDKGQALEFKGIDDLSTFTYDNKGNMVKMVSNTTTTTASYTNDKGILSAVNTPSWVFMLTDLDLYYYAVNNPIAITEIYQENGPAETVSQTITYPAEHIILGYPTRMNISTTEAGQTNSGIFSIVY